jgi:acyl-CoA synthetase (NDP forming)/enoyl-CoA hydratase/carnithine racemase
MTSSTHRLNKLLRPRSIALVGASPRSGSFGHMLRQSIQSLAYEGELFLVNPKHEEIDGQRAYRGLLDLPHAPDCVALAIADSAVPHALEAAALIGAGAAVLFGRAHGTDARGRPLTDTIAHIARAARMPLCGANCMGFVNLDARLQMTGFPFADLREPGHVALVSHSGSTWSGIVGNLRDLRFNCAISAGQELATGVADYIDYLVEQATTRVICLVLETVREPEAFLAALTRARSRGIAVIALKLGRSERGQAFAKSHSGALSGSADVLDAVFARQGVIGVRSLDEMMDTAELFAAPRLPHNGLIGLGSDSGGERQLIVDLAEPLGLPFAPLASATVATLNGLLSPGIEASNPLDYWGDGHDVIADCLLALAQDSQVGTLVMATNMAPGQDFVHTCARALEKTWANTPKPVVLMGNLGATLSPTACSHFRAMGLPVLMGTETGLRALAHYSRHHEAARLAANAAGIAHRPHQSPGVSAERLAHWQATLKACAAAGQTLQNFELLQDFGLPVAPGFSSTELSQALAFAERIGYPLVAKVDAPDVAHKSELGGVILGIGSDAQLRDAWAELQAKVPGAVLLQRQMQGTELILGMQQDPSFGPIFTVGLGGIFVEIMKDVARLLPGDDEETIRQALAGLRGAPLLQGARGRPVADMAQLVCVIQNFMAMGLALRDDIQEMEINPLLVNGTQMAAADCLFIPRAKRLASPTPMIHVPKVASSSDREPAVLTSTHGKVGLIRLNRARKLNAINGQMMEEATQALKAFANNPAIGAIVLAGEGRSFCAGFDLKELAEQGNTTAEQWAAVLKADFDFVIQFWDCPKPTVAAIHGHCIGGGLELAVSCDITIADADTLMGEPEMKFGSSIAAMVVPWLVGAKYAKEMLLTGNDRISAQRAHEVGLVNEVTTEGRHLERALAVAAGMANCSTVSVQLTKRAINQSFELSGMRQALLAAVDTATTIESTARIENLAFEDIRKSQGMKAAVIWREQRI